MRIFVYIVILAVFLASYLSSPAVGLAPAQVKFLPDLLAALAAVYVVAAGAQQNFRYVDSKYWLIFGGLAFLLVASPIVNSEGPGPIVNGLRAYARAIPYFFIPAVAKFSEKDLKSFFTLIVALSLLQVPLALYQRYSLIQLGSFTGDPVFGTLMLSGVLSIFLICVICFLAAATIKGHLSRFKFACLFILLLIPMSVNETKVTVFLLPLALLTTFWIASRPGRRLVTIAGAAAALAAAAAIFIPAYNYLNTLNNPVPFTIQDFFGKSNMIDQYLNKESKLGSGEEAGRMDSVTMPFVRFANDPVKLAFGLGPGNASKSSLGTQFSGDYQSIYWPYVQTLSMSAILFELGVFGAALVLLLHVVVLKDTIWVGQQEGGALSWLAPGFAGTWVAVTIGLFYVSIHTFDVISAMFWLFAGLYAAERQRMIWAGRTKVSMEPTTPKTRASGVKSGKRSHADF